MPSEALPPLADWGLNHSPDYLMERFKYYRKTHRFPNGKSYDEQRKSLLDDFKTIEYLIDWHKQQLLIKRAERGG